MFKKEDLFVHEMYSPPAGEKEIFIFPRIFGGTEYYTFFRKIILNAKKTEMMCGMFIGVLPPSFLPQETRCQYTQ